MTSQYHSPGPEELLAHAEWARALARRLVGDASTADDVVQDTWVAALGSPPRAGDPVRPWLGRVLQNVVHQRQRSEGRRTHREREASRSEALPSAAELTQRTEAQRSLMDALLELDEQLRTVVLLRYFEGLSSAEIARRQGLPAGTVRWRLKRGLDELRVILEERAGGRGADWCAALVPLLRVPQRSAAGTIGFGATWKVLLSMKLLAKTLAVALVLVGGAFLLDAAGILRWSGPTPREAVQFRPLELSAVPTLLDASAPGPGADVARAAISEPVSEPQSGGLPSPTVRARFMDADGVPVAGVRAELWPTREPAVATSGLDGMVALQASLYGGSMGSELRFAHPRHASDKVEFASREGELDLGDLVLHPGGAIHGSVVDPAGLPLAGCEIEVYGREVSENSVGGMRMSYRSGLGAARTTTDAQGQFSLAGLLAGDVLVLAEMPDELHKGTSGLVEVRAGEESYGLVIVAEAIPQSDRIEGVVLDPDGQPVPRASVSARYRSFWSSGSMGVTADQEGRFRILVRNSGDHELTAEDPRDRWGPVRLDGVEPGELDVKLRFADLGNFQVRLVDASGRPLERASLAVRTADGDDVFEWRSNIALDLDDGQASLRLPAESFLLEVWADGYDRLRAGPFGPSSLSGVLELELESLPGLTGTVTADGEPLEGVSLTVHRRARGRTLHNGFPVHFEPQPVSRATSDAEGRFALTVRESGSYVLRAAPSGTGALLAPTELELPDVDPGAGRSGITLELSPGGVLEGRVVAPAGGRASTVVAISRGDGNVRTQRVPAGGTFRFEGLTPGRWLVVQRESELAPGSSSTSSDSSTPWRELPWSCEVFEGQTTIHDLVLGETETARLEGHLTLDQPLPRNCVAALIPLEDDAGSLVSGSYDEQLDREGAFALDALEGRYRLTVSLGPGAPVLLEELTIGAGTTAWNRELETGALTIEGLAPPTDTDRAPLLLVWEGPGGLWALAPLTADEEGRAHIPLFPAGSVRVVRAVRGLSGDPRAFPVLLELEVSAGETTRARIDG